MTAHAWAMASIRHSSASRVPSGVPSSKYARRYHAPSHDVLLDRLRERGRPRAVLLGTLPISARLADRREARQDVAEEPREPHALALALVADPVHAVVPVAAADQRQPVHAGRPAGLDRADAVLVDRLGGLGDRRLDVGVLLVERQSRGLDEGRALVEHARVARRLDVLGDDKREPVAIVGDVRADSSARVRLPPVLDVALGELVSARLEDLLCAPGPGERPAAPARLGAGLGSRTRRSTGTLRCGPTDDTPSPDREADR